MKPAHDHRSLPSIINFLLEPEYVGKLIKYAFPIALQQFIMSALNMVGTVMLGQLGETAIAAVGLANQVFFLFQLLLFGVTSGSAMFTAQLWGKKDVANIHRVLGLCLSLALLISVVFWIIAVVFPEEFLGIYSNDPAVISLGSQYLRIFGWVYGVIAITFSFASILRSTGNVTVPLIVSISALGLNTLLSYGLIFGKFGLPAWGVEGAATAGLIARIVECSALLWATRRWRLPAAASIMELFKFDRTFAGRVLKPVLPVAANEMFWSLGITTYNIVYARIGTEAIAAMNIAATIDQIALVLFIGLGHATAILVGHWIGGGNEGQAFRYAGRSLIWGGFGAFIVGGLIIGISPRILPLYKVSPAVLESTRKILTIIGLLLWLRVTNMIIVIGILRSGGDTRFSLFLDGIIIWIIGVPMAFISAFLLLLPVHWVYLMVMSEEITKCVLGLRRYFSRKWIHNLAETVS